MLPAMPTPEPRDFSAAPAQGPSFKSTLLWTLAALAVVLAWDASALDLAMARWFGDADGFALRSDWFFEIGRASELQSQSNLVCRLLLEKKNNINSVSYTISICK